jgi:4-hydroxy-2-oxoglutarate aldolase
VKLEGVYLPVTTPFDPARGGIDLEAFGRNLRSWSEHPVAGYVIAGSTGEAPLLDEPEIEALVAKARDVVGESAAVLAGTGLESTRATIRLGQIAAQAGAEALLVRPPSYYKGQMTPEALRVHFLEVADSAPVPVVLYHVPKFVPVGLEPELVAELAGHENIIGIKDSSGDIHGLGTLCTACADRATVLVGAGTHLYSGLEIGAAGGIVAVGLLAPGAATGVFDAWQAGRGSEAGRLQERIGPLHKRVIGGTGIPGVKHALDLLGMAGGRPRSPLISPSEAVRSEVADALVAAGLLDRDQAPGG